MNAIAEELRDIADKAEAGNKPHWANAMRAAALQLNNWQRDIETYRLRLDHHDAQSDQLRRLLDSARHYCDNYLRDESDDPELCYDDKHRAAVVALWDALENPNRGALSVRSIA